MFLVRSNRAFSLVEAIVGITIIAAIAVVSYLGAGTCFRADLHNSDQTLAVHLLQKSQEEIRLAAQSHYDQLNTCDFVAGNTCGLSETLPTGFDRFTRSMAIVDEGSTELKRIEIQVQWTDVLGNVHMMPSVMFMSRPPNPLPGNIIGVVTDESNGNLLGGVLVQITNGTVTHAITSTGSLTGKNVNYDFSQSTGGTFNIEVGAWNLTATRDGYEPTTINNIDVLSNAERRVDFTMKPLPEPRQIIARLRNTETGSYVSFGHSYSWIRLYEDGSLRHRVRYTGQLTWTVDFDDTNPRYFTVNTDQAFYSMYVGNFACNSASFRYYADGWSSAVVRDDLASPALVDCTSYPWNGNAMGGTDRIQVTPGPGPAVNVDVWVHPVPLARVWGYLRDQNGNPVSNGYVYGYWHNGRHIRRVPTESDGSYEIYLPAQQEIEPWGNSIGNHPRVRGRAARQIVLCCDNNSWQTVYSPVYRVNSGGNPVLEGGDYRVDISIDLTPQIQDCGNAGGRVVDIQSGGGLSNARAYLRGDNRLTDGAGNYVFDCGSAPPPYCLLQRWYYYRGRRSGYYPFDSRGGAWYSDRSDIFIQQDMTNAVPDIEMLSLCRSSITVQVNDTSTGYPVPNANLTLDAHNESGSSISLSGVTNSSGSYTFNNVIETWPTPYTSGHPSFKQTIRQHSLSVDSSAFYDPLVISPIILNCGVPRTIQADLVPKDQM